MEQIKNLGGLVNQDLAFIKHSPDLVYNSENFVITTDEGGTYTVRTNIKGNYELFYLPGIDYKSKIELNQIALIGIGYIVGTNYTLNFTINGTPYTLRFDFISYEDILYKLYLAIVDSKSNNTEWSVISDVRYISNGADSFIDISSAISLTITCDEDIFIFSNDYQSALSNNKIIGWTTIRDDIYLISTNGTFNPDLEELPTGNEYTQIWKVTYDKASDYTDSVNYTTTLIWNGLLNMTIYRPIANPGMIIGRYENEDIQKIYWTDNYNTPRFINVANPNAFYLTPDQLDLFPKLNISEPRLEEIIQAGNILEGTYQAAYRLSKVSGGETVFSGLSNPVHIVKTNDSSTPYVGSTKSQDPTNHAFVAGNPSYQGSMVLGNANKSLKYVISNIDTNYDYIELCIVYRNKLDSIPTTIQVVRKEPITLDTMSLVYTGNESVVSITLDELNLFTTSITRAKSINTKNNYLFLSNVDASTRILNFDSRTYRFPLNSTETKVYDQFNTSTLIDGTYTLPDNHDAIQNYDFQNPYENPYGAENYLYQYNSEEFGGSGPNISYRFLSWDECKDAGIYIVLDDNNIQTNTTSSDDYGTNINPDDTWNDPTFKSYYPPYKKVSLATNTYSTSVSNLGQEYYLNNSFESYVSPYLATLFKTYRRDEMYRFGIQFYDKRGNPYFVKWISDIRMPHIYMPNTSGDKELQFPLTQYENGVLYAYPLVIQFTVDTSSIDDLISGYHIVRCERKKTDKHIVHQGVINPSIEKNTDTWFTQSNDDHGNGLKIGSYKFDGQQMYYYSPDVAFSQTAYIDKDDYVEVVSLMDNTLTFLSSSDTNEGHAAYMNTTNYVVKNYEYSDTPATIPYSVYNYTNQHFYQVKDYKLFKESWNTAGLNGGTSQHRFLFANKEFINAGMDYRSTYIHNGGNRGLLLEIYGDGDGNFDYGSYNVGDAEAEVNDEWVSVETSSGVTNVNNKAYIANCRKNIEGQYGGNTYSQRSNSEYIKCSPITTNSSINVLQGDTFINVIDYMARNSNFTDFSNSALDFGLLRLIPLETSLNIDLRIGALCTDETYSDYIGLPNREWQRGADAGQFDLTSQVANEKIPKFGHLCQEEAFNYNSVYSNENNIRKYFPQSLIDLNTGKYDVRTYKTAQKINGENGESWSDVKEEAYLEVDSSFGPINNTILFRDKVYFIQDKGFGVFSIGEQRLQQNDAGENLILGQAGILERFDYISTKTGSKHQFSFSVSDYSMLWFDTLARKIIRYIGEGLQPLSDIKGLSAHFYNRLDGNIQITDNPYIGKGVHATYDYRFNRHFMTFLHEDDQTKITVIYNEPLDGFEGFTSCYPEVYINDKLNIFTIPYTDNSTQDLLYIQNYGPYSTFFGRTYPSVISTLVNENPTEEKVLTNLEIIADGYSTNSYSSPQYDPVAEINRSEFFDLIRVYDSYQNTDYQGLNNLSRRHKTIWNVKVPSDRVKTVNSNIFNPANLEVNRPALTRRMKDKWFMVDLIYNNTDNKKFVAQTLKGIYSMNSR